MNTNMSQGSAEPQNEYGGYGFGDFCPDCAPNGEPRWFLADPPPRVPACRGCGVVLSKNTLRYAPYVIKNGEPFVTTSRDEARRLSKRRPTARQKAGAACHDAARHVVVVGIDIGRAKTFYLLPVMHHEAFVARFAEPFVDDGVGGTKFYRVDLLDEEGEASEALSEAETWLQKHGAVAVTGTLMFCAE